MERYLSAGIPLPLNGKIYEIQEIVGQGSSCVVYRANRCEGQGIYTEHLLKEYNPMHLNISRNEQGQLIVAESQKGSFDSGLRRFRAGYQYQSEIRQQSTLKNFTSNIQEIYSANGTEYIDMSCFHGKTYDQVEELSLSDLLRRLRTIAGILNEYHKLGFLYLDLKPENIFTLPETCELVLLFDFDSMVKKENVQATGLSYTKKWAAPEQLWPKRHHEICESTDLFALGEILFYKIMGRHSDIDDRTSFADYTFDLDSPLFRNVDAKVTAELTDFFHHTICGMIKKRYVSAGEAISALDRLIRLADPKEPRLLPNIVLPIANFVGRAQELSAIRVHLNHQKALFLQGIGGIGKSELASQFAKRYERDYNVIVFAHNLDGLEAMFASDQISIANGPVRQPRESLADYSRRKRGYFRSLCDEKTLLIIDNMDDPEDPLLPDVLSWTCQILITTRTDFSAYGYPQLTVDTLRDEEIESVFRNNCRHTPDAGKRAAIQELIALVDRHTMAVALLARQLNASDLEPGELLALLRKQGLQNSGRERLRVEKDGDHSLRSAFGHIQALFNLAELDQSQQDALMMMSLLPYTGVAKKKLRSWCGWESLETLNRLIESGWVKDLPNRSAALHPLVAEVAFQRLKDTPVACLPFLDQIRRDTFGKKTELDPKQRQANAELFDVLSSKVLDLFADDSVFESLNHVELKCVALFFDYTPKALSGFGYIDRQLQCRMRALAILQLLASASNAEDKQALEVASELNSLAVLYLSSGQLSLAEDAFLHTLEIRKKASLPDTNGLAQCYANLRTLYKNMNRFSEAKQFGIQALELYQGLSDDLAVANALNGLGRLYRASSNFTTAIDCHQKALTLQKSKLGEQHPTVAITRMDLGNLYFNQSHFPDALREYRATETIYLKHYGEEYRDTATIWNNLGAVYSQMGDFETAERYYLKSLHIREKLFGPLYPDTINSYYNLGSFYQKRDEYSKAESCYSTVLDARQRLYGEESSPVADVLTYWGSLCRETGQLEKSETFLLHAKAIYENLYLEAYPNHQNLGAIYGRLSRLYSVKWQLVLAIDYRQKALEISLNTFGANNINTAESMLDLGLLYQKNGQLNEAEKQINQAYDIYQSFYGEQNIKLTTILTARGNLAYCQGLYDSAVDFYKKVLDLYRNAYGTKPHSSYVAALSNLALAEMRVNDIVNAEKHYFQGLDMMRQLTDQNNQGTASILNNIGTFYYYQEDYAKAKDFYQQALEMRTSLFGERHKQTASTLGNLGLLYGKQGKFVFAEEFCRKEIEIVRSFSDIGSIPLADAYHRMGLVYAWKKDPQAARKYLSEALKIRKEFLGDAHPFALEVQHDLDQLT